MARGRAHDARTAITVTVHGHVQGVGFRYHTRSTAVRLGLTGYVRNMPDGTVEVVCEGPARATSEMASWLRHGPPGARVIQVEIRNHEPTGTFRSFNVEF